MILTRETHFPFQFANRISFKDTVTKNKFKQSSLKLSTNHLNNKSNRHHNKSDLVELRLSDRSVMAIEPIRKTTSDAASAAAKASSLILTSGASGRINAFFSFRVLKSVVMLVCSLLLLLLFPFRGRKRASSFVNSSSSAIEDKDGNNDEKKVGGGGTRVPAKIVLPPWRSAAVKTVAANHEATARRAIAIRRVVQDCDGENVGDERSVREFELFGSARGDTMFAQSWSPPASIEIRGVVVLLHGLNEHSGRYNNFARQLNAYGYKVYAMDWIGHGGSDGLHAYVPNLDDAVADLISYFEKVSAENPGLPCFCFGHSTGAAIILKAVLDPKVESRVAGVVLTSPAVGVQPAHPVFVLIAPIVSFLLPKYQLSAANKQGMAVSRDPEALVAKYSDPLVFTGSIRVRTGYEILRITSYLQQNLKRFRVPFLVLHGTADSVTDPEASQKLYKEASSTDKTIKLYDGLLHDLLFEPERDEIAQDIIDWLNSRVNNNV